MRDEPDARIRRIAALLPEYYRENQEELGAPLRVAEEMVASADAHLLRARERLNDDALLALKERWFPPDRAALSGAGAAGSGTRRELLRWFRAQAGRAPAVWSGFEVRSIGVDYLQARRSRRPSAVLVWRREGLSDSSTPPPPPPGMVPLRTRLQLILPLSEDEVSVPCHGRVLRARILFDSRSFDVEA